MIAKVFSERHGFPIHWEVTGEDLGQLQQNIADMLAWLESEDFTGHVGFGQKPAPAASGKSGGGARKASVRDCPECGGPTWDNRASIADGSHPKSPLFSCRDREGCGWADWPAKEGKKPFAKKSRSEDYEYDDEDNT